MIKKPFSQLMYGTHYKYDRTDETAYVKIGRNLVAEYRCGPLSEHQSLCCFAVDADLPQGLDQEVYVVNCDESLRYALRRIVQSTDGAHIEDHHWRVHKSAMQLAHDTLYASAPAEVDERADFEAWVQTQRVCTRKGAKLWQNKDGSYKDYRINDRWITWQARAGVKR